MVHASSLVELAAPKKPPKWTYGTERPERKQVQNPQCFKLETHFIKKVLRLLSHMMVSRLTHTTKVYTQSRIAG